MKTLNKLNKTLKYFILINTLFLFNFSPLHALDTTQQKNVEAESNYILEQSLKVAKQFYSLGKHETFKEMTNVILASKSTKESTKQLIRATGRRFFLFQYPSDGYQVKGYLSFVPNSEHNPLLIFLRGGNQTFGLMNPANEITLADNYTVITTTYRGGVSEGTDEFGGAEVNDVYNLIKYFPILQEKIDTHFSPKETYLLGVSRGGMELFLALNRSIPLQHFVTKAVSISGMLDLQDTIHAREDMRNMFIENFGLNPNNQDAWIAHRNPITNISHLRKDLPILILQGTNDLRVNPREAIHMAYALKSHGNPVTYLEVPGGDHGLMNQPNRMNIILHWLESSTT